MGMKTSSAKFLKDQAVEEKGEVNLEFLSGEDCIGFVKKVALQTQFECRSHYLPMHFFLYFITEKILC